MRNMKGKSPTDWLNGIVVISLLSTSVDMSTWLETPSHVPYYFSTITIEGNLILKPLVLL